MDNLIHRGFYIGTVGLARELLHDHAGDLTCLTGRQAGGFGVESALGFQGIDALADGDLDLIARHHGGKESFEDFELGLLFVCQILTTTFLELLDGILALFDTAFYEREGLVIGEEFG